MVPGVIVWLLCGFQHQSLEVVWLPTSLPQRADTFIENGLVSWVGYCKLWVGVLSFYLVSPLSLFTFMHWRRKWQPTPVFLPGESRDGGAWWAAIYGVAQSQTRLKWLSSSSSPCPLIYYLPLFYIAVKIPVFQGKKQRLQFRLCGWPTE